MPGPAARAMIRRIGVGALVVALVAIGPLPPTSGSASTLERSPEQVSATSIGSSRFVPVEPCRLLDTRDGGTAPGLHAVLTVPVAGRCGVPDGATAAAVTITSVRPTSNGYLAAYASGTVWPGTSTVNVRAGEVRANGALVRLGGNGAMAIRVAVSGHVVVDVSGAFVPAETSAEGRFVSMAQRRVLDTRDGGRPVPGGTVRVPIPDGVPNRATALAINVTTTVSSGPGFFTVHPAGSPRPTASVLNTDAPGQTRAASIAVPISDAGLDIYSSAGDHVIVDVAGYFTGSGANRSPVGLFVPIRPTRLADTRLDGQIIHRSGTREWATGAVIGQAGAVVSNITMVEPASDGFVFAHASRTATSTASSVNGSAGAAVANVAVVPVSTAGIAVTASTGTHVVVDVTGWFTGRPRSTTEPPPVNVAPGPGRTLVIGDSVAAAFRYSTGALTNLQGYPYVLDVRECRRTIGTSCVIRGGTRPSNAVDAIRAASGEFDTVVMMTGYNDSASNFATAIDHVMATARAKGARQVVWLTVRAGGSSNYAGINDRIRAAPVRHPEAKVADWNAHAGGQRGWFAGDNVHLNGSGAAALARFIDAELWRLS